MSGFFLKIVQWFLPIFLDWSKKVVTEELEKARQKHDEEKARGEVDLKNLKKLNDCESLNECINAAKNTFNNVDSSTP